MAYILTPRFAQAYQAPQCNPFGFYAPSCQPAYGYRTVQRSRPQHEPQPRRSPFASFFSQLDELVGEIDRESQRQAQVEAQREAQQAAQIKAAREAYQAHVEAQRAAYRQRQAEIEAHIAAQREAHRQRQLRKRAFRAQFAVTQDEQGWQVDAELLGFEQENISIELTDENTLKIAGNTEWGAKPRVEAHPEVETTPAVESSIEEASEQTIESADEKMEGITLEPAADLESTTEAATDSTDIDSVRPGTPESDTSSRKSYQPTVEDDFEDLGPEASTLFSTPSTSATTSEPKGKEKVVEPVEHEETAEDPEVSIPIETAILPQPQREVAAPQQQEQDEEERFHGSFERTYRFPERIDGSNVSATLKEGVLRITVPRAQAQPARRIAIL